MALTGHGCLPGGKEWTDAFRRLDPPPRTVFSVAVDGRAYARRGMGFATRLTDVDRDPARMLDDGGVEDWVRLVRPALLDTMAGEALAASNWQDAAPDHWRALWEAELKALPTHTESRLWLVSGLLLPLWDRLPTDSVRERTLATDAGATHRPGVVGLTAEEVCEAVLDRGTAFCPYRRPARHAARPVPAVPHCRPPRATAPLVPST